MGIYRPRRRRTTPPARGKSRDLGSNNLQINYVGVHQTIITIIIIRLVLSASLKHITSYSNILTKMINIFLPCALLAGSPLQEATRATRPRHGAPLPGPSPCMCIYIYIYIYTYVYIYIYICICTRSPLSDLLASREGSHPNFQICHFSQHLLCTRLPDLMLFAKRSMHLTARFDAVCNTFRRGGR